MASNLTMDNLAKIYTYCDYVIQKNMGRDIISIFEALQDKPKEEVTAFIMDTLGEDDILKSLFSRDDVTLVMGELITQMGSNAILRLDNSIIQNSNLPPDRINFNPSEEQVKRVFAGLRRNKELFERFYKGKEWEISIMQADGNLGVKNIQVTPSTFMHLLGFETKYLLKMSSHPDLVQQFAAPLLNPNEAERLMTSPNDKKLMDLLQMLIDSEGKVIEYACDGRLRQSVNFDKVEMKNFAFERTQPYEHASGIILFDKQLAKSKGYQKLDHIDSDLILLQDFIRRHDATGEYGLDYVFSVFARKGKTHDQQSSVISGAAGGGPNSGFIDGQQHDLSPHIELVQEPTLDFDVRVKKGNVAPTPMPNLRRVNEYGYNPSNPVTLADLSKLKPIELVGIPRKSDKEIQKMFEQKSTGDGHKKI